MSSKTVSVLELLSDLVAFPSITPASAGSLEYIAEFIQNLGGSVTWINRNATSNLLATLGSGPCSLAFAGHVDVVPTGAVSLWRGEDPFTLYRDGEQIIGRGVADMKGAIAAFLVALKQFVAGHAWSSFKIHLALTSDEEGSAIDGTPLIVAYMKEHQLRFNYCIVGEPSATAQVGDSIKVGRRGSLTGELDVHGQQGHIAYPDLCENPIHKFAPALAELSTMVFDRGDEYFPATSLQFANLNAGLGATNVIPGLLRTNFNFRYNPQQTAEKLQEQVVAVLERHQLKYTLQWQHSAKPFMTQPGQLLQVTQAAITAVCQLTPATKTDGGTSDGRFLIEVCDEIIEFGLPNASIHQINESTSLRDLNLLSESYLAILKQLFASKV